MRFCVCWRATYLLVERAHGAGVAEGSALAGARVAVHAGDLVVGVGGADAVVGEGLDHGAVPVAAIVDGVVASALGRCGGSEQRSCGGANKLLHIEDDRKVASALGSNLAWVSVFVKGCGGVAGRARGRSRLVCCYCCFNAGLTTD